MATEPVAKTNWGAEAGAYTSVITTILGVASTMEDIEARNEALMTNMGNQAESFKYTQNVQGEQLDDLDRALAGKLSASGLESMKTESRLKAASAETGGTGTSNQDAINTAEVNRLNRDAALYRTADVQKKSKMNEMVASRLNFENTLESMISGQQSALSAGLQTANAGLKGMGFGLMMMSDASKEAFYGTNTTGEE